MNNNRRDFLKKAGLGIAGIIGTVLAKSVCAEQLEKKPEDPDAKFCEDPKKWPGDPVDLRWDNATHRWFDPNSYKPRIEPEIEVECDWLDCCYQNNGESHNTQTFNTNSSTVTYQTKDGPVTKPAMWNYI